MLGCATVPGGYSEGSQRVVRKGAHSVLRGYAPTSGDACVRRCVRAKLCAKMRAGFAMRQIAVVATRRTLEASHGNALTLLRTSICTRAVRTRKRVAGVRCLGLRRGNMPSRATWLRGRVRVRGAAGTARRVVEAVRRVRVPHGRVTRAYGRAVHVREPDTQRHYLGARRTKRISACECALRPHNASVWILVRLY